MDAIKFDKSIIYKTDPKLPYLIYRCLTAMECRQRIRKLMFFAEAIKLSDVQICRKVKERILVILKKLVGRPTWPVVNIDLGVIGHSIGNYYNGWLLQFKT